jgi:hypothetical protein
MEVKPEVSEVWNFFQDDLQKSWAVSPTQYWKKHSGHGQALANRTKPWLSFQPGNTNTIDLLFDWFGLVCLQIKRKIVSCHTADSKPVKQEVNSTVILSPSVFPVSTIDVGMRPFR